MDKYFDIYYPLPADYFVLLDGRSHLLVRKKTRHALVATRNCTEQPNPEDHLGYGNLW